MSTKKVVKVVYSENNSRWWLTKKHYEALAKAGWDVRWDKDSFLGRVANDATRRGLTLSEAVEEWERATHLSSCDAGCPCGPPHHFSGYDAADNWVESGPESHYSVGW